jgi:hypothetical protein
LKFIRVIIMKKLTAILVLTTFLSVPGLATAKTIGISAKMNSYRGPDAYLAVYLTDPNGRYHSTLALAGRKSKYRKHLRGWFRGASSSRKRIDGVTGASVGSKQSMKINVKIADTLIDAGYKIHVDSAVEDVGEYKSDVVVPLESKQSGQAIPGRGFVRSFTVKM